MSVFAYTNGYVYMICIYVYMYMCMCICICMYIYTHTYRNDSLCRLFRKRSCRVGS